MYNQPVELSQEIVQAKSTGGFRKGLDMYVAKNSLLHWTA